jgi:hypothetical protein
MQLTCKYLLAAAWLFWTPVSLPAADDSYFVTYSHQMEEPGSLEISFSHVLAKPEGGHRFLNTLVELEYGVRGWWTSELYLSGQSTASESTLFTGYRWENRFRPLLREHWINPVLYVEFSHTSGADKSLKEIVGFDGRDDLLAPNSETALEKKRELETKLILSSNLKGWNVSENFIAEKNLGGAPWEFGYAFGLSRPLALAASPKPCRLCRENFLAGLEMYGGLGTRYDFGLHGTSHYVAPTLAWQLADGTTVRVSPSFGVTANSNPFLLRFGVSYEVSQLARALRRSIHGATP